MTHNIDIPFISIIITTFNRAYIIENALNSLLEQDFKNWQAIIVDDGSIDNTFNTIQKYCNNDKRFIYIYQKNQKQAMAKNMGLTTAQGKYITFLDSDDRFKPNHISSKVKLIAKYPEVDLFHGGVEITGDEYVPDRDNPDSKIHLNKCVIGGTFVFKREILKKTGYFDNIKYGDDTAFFEKCINNNMTIYKTDLKTYIYNRNSSDSLCNNFKN